MAAVQRKLVHKQFNSPMGLYSEQNVKETLNRELKAFGSEGIEIDEQISKPLNLANSAVLRAVEEEEQMKCEPLKKCIRESRSRQRFQQRPHTPVHQQQLEQIKTQYLSHQHDITIDRDTVLKINRLATRRNLHKRDHSWPPTFVTATATATDTAPQMLLKNADDERNNAVVVQHVRSTSNDNALQFDETVCKRHGIDIIREKFNSPTRIIEPTPQEIRQRRQKLLKQQQQHTRSRSGDDGGGGRGLGVVYLHKANKPKEMINLVKHEKLLKQNNVENKTKTFKPQESDKRPKEEEEVSVGKQTQEAELYQTSTGPAIKGFSHPETKAADENIGLVEPKRQFYEQLAVGKKWYSYENLLAAVNNYATIEPKIETSHRRQAYSLERGRDKRLHRQLPPQKPRGTPKLQRRSMKLSTEIKICYDTDAQQHNIQVKSLNQPQKSIEEDLEHIPLPAIPDKSKTMEIKGEQNSNKTDRKTLNDQAVYDDSCIYLRSIDLEDNTIAYIPAAITIVPSPTEEIMQHWLESNKLKANINDKQKMTDHAPVTPPGTIKTDKQNDIKIETKPTTCTAKDIHSNVKNNKNNTGATTPTTFFEDIKSPTKNVYYTDGEYLYGPCDPHNGKPLPNATVRSLEAEQQKQKQKFLQIKKVTQADTESHLKQDKHEIANLTAKYEHIQKSINEHLKQIEAYIENAKTALKSTLNQHKTENKTESSSTTTITCLTPAKFDKSLDSRPSDLKVQHQAETPLKEILRKLNVIMQEVKPLGGQHTGMAPKTPTNDKQPKIEDENMPIVDKVLLDLNLLTRHLTELDKSSSFGGSTAATATAAAATTTELKPIIEQLQKQALPIDLQYENQQPIACQPVYNALENKKEENKEMPLNKAKGQIPTLTPAPPPPPPPPPPAPSLTSSIKEQKHWPEEHKVADEQLLATDKKLITVQTQASAYCDAKKQTIKAIATPKEYNVNAHDDDDDDGKVEKKKTAHFDFITQRHQQQEKLVEQVIDTLGKLENKSKENLVNTHVQPTPTATATTTKKHSYDEQQQIKSNLNQQTPQPASTPTPTPTPTPTLTTTAAAAAVKDDVLVSLQKCNVNILANASSKLSCNHDNDLKKPSSKGNTESQLKLCFKDIADKIADKQFQKYDNQLLTKNTNDVVNNNNTRKPSQEHKHVCCPYQYDNTATATDTDTDNVNFNKIKNHNNINNKTQKQQHKMLTEVVVVKEKEKEEEEEGDSNHSSGSELSNTYKSSYDLPSPYITERQITWQDVKQTNTHNQKSISNESKETLTTATTFDNIKPKHQHNIQIVEKSTKTMEGLKEISPKTTATATMKTTSGHVKMQSMTASKPRIQTRKQQSQQQQQYPFKTSHNNLEDIKKYPAPLIEPHIPTRASSPFGLNAVDITPFSIKQHSNSPSPSPSPAALTSSGRCDIRKYPSPLAEPHLPTRATSPFGLNAVEMTNAKRSKSKSPKPWHNDESSPSSTCTRKYPARLVEPHKPNRAASPFGLNAVEIADDDDEQQKQDKLDSPIRKYPPALIEPHVPTRAASPFGLNAVIVTPTPPLTSTSARGSDSTRKMTVVYVPQVEGHNIGLLVRATTPQPYNTYQPDNSATMIASNFTTDIISSGKTLYNYNTVPAATQEYSCGNKCRATTNDNIERAAAAADKDDDNDDELTCDELQHINTIVSNKQGTIKTTTTIPATTSIANIHLQQTTHQLHNNVYEQGTTSSGGDVSQQSVVMPIDTTIPLPTSFINRSYDNVSPRPYITIEGYKRVAWPPVSEERIVREFTPQPQTQYQPVPAYNQQQQQPQAQQQTTAAPAQPQQQPHMVSHDQVDQQAAHLAQNQRGTSPGIITLRKEAPITQQPAPVYTSQPAAVSFRESSADTDSLGGSKMRGDLKWPPPEYKEAAAKENEERRKLALGPVCRPRKVHRDYTAFFAKNALSHHYPSYKVPPGTQHMIN